MFGKVHRPGIYWDDGAFLRDVMISIEGRGQNLFAGRVQDQVTGQLPGDELIVG